PLVIGPQELQQTGSHRLSVLARLAPGVDRQRAAVEMRTIAQRLESVRPQSHTAHGVDVASLHGRLAEDAPPALLTVPGRGGLGACGNVANVLLARASRREREIAVRAAVGASQGRLLRQLLVESLLLALLGGAAGLLAGAWGSRLLVGFLPPETPRLREAGIDG